MKNIVDYKDSYKDEVTRFASNGIVIARAPDFNLGNEFKFLMSQPKNQKSDTKFFICVNNDKKPVGAIGFNKSGEILIIATAKTDADFALDVFLKKCDELIANNKYDKISAVVDVKYIERFNKSGFKSVRCFEKIGEQFNFVVEKRSAN